MVLTLRLSPVLKASLEAESTRTGKQPETLVLEALEEKFAAHDASPPKMSYESWRVEFDVLMATMPPGSLHADWSRENIYEGCGE